RALMDKIADKTGAPLRSTFQVDPKIHEKRSVIPADRVRYLAESSETCRRYAHFVAEQVALAGQLYQLRGTIHLLRARVGQKRIEIHEPETTTAPGMTGAGSASTPAPGVTGVADAASTPAPGVQASVVRVVEHVEGEPA